MAGTAHFSVSEQLRDGRLICIRAIRPDDKARLTKAFHALDPQSVYRRVFHMKNELTADELRQLTEVDHVRDVALVATIGRGASELIVGGGRYMASGRSAEIAFTIEEDYQQQGIARLLLQHLVQIAREHGIAQFEAQVLADNRAMLGVFERSGLPMQAKREQGVLHVTLQITGSGARGQYNEN